jgi:hypothetical protein
MCTGPSALKCVKGRVELGLSAPGWPGNGLSATASIALMLMLVPVLTVPIVDGRAMTLRNRLAWYRTHPELTFSA